MSPQHNHSYSVLSTLHHPSSPLIPQLNKQPKLLIKSTINHDNTQKLINTEATGAMYMDVHVCVLAKRVISLQWLEHRGEGHPSFPRQKCQARCTIRERKSEGDKELWNIRPNRWKCEWWMSRKREKEIYSWVSKEIHMNEERLEEQRWRESREEYTQSRHRRIWAREGQTNNLNDNDVKLGEVQGKVERGK